MNVGLRITRKRHPVLVAPCQSLPLVERSFAMRVDRVKSTERCKITLKSRDPPFLLVVFAWLSQIILEYSSRSSSWHEDNGAPPAQFKTHPPTQPKPKPFPASENPTTFIIFFVSCLRLQIVACAFRIITTQRNHHHSFIHSAKTQLIELHNNLLLQSSFHSNSIPANHQNNVNRHFHPFFPGCPNRIQQQHRQQQH